MTQTQARAWWADVEHLREDLERRRDERRAPLVPVDDVLDGWPGRRAAVVGERVGRARAGGALGPPPRTHAEVVRLPVSPRARRRRRARGAGQLGQRPDRLALWALVMGIVLLLAAVTTADAATLAAV